MKPFVRKERRVIFIRTDLDWINYMYLNMFFEVQFSLHKFGKNLWQKVVIRISL